MVKFIIEFTNGSDVPEEDDHHEPIDLNGLRHICKGHKYGATLLAVGAGCIARGLDICLIDRERNKQNGSIFIGKRDRSGTAGQKRDSGTEAGQRDRSGTDRSGTGTILTRWGVLDRSSGKRDRLTRWGVLDYGSAMPRTARVAPGGMVFHVLNRGVARMQLTFRTSALDYPRISFGAKLRGAVRYRRSSARWLDAVTERQLP